MTHGPLTSPTRALQLLERVTLPQWGAICRTNVARRMVNHHRMMGDDEDLRG